MRFHRMTSRAFTGPYVNVFLREKGFKIRFVHVRPILLFQKKLEVR